MNLVVAVDMLRLEFAEFFKARQDSACAFDLDVDFISMSILTRLRCLGLALIIDGICMGRGRRVGVTRLDLDLHQIRVSRCTSLFNAFSP